MKKLMTLFLSTCMIGSTMLTQVGAQEKKIDTNSISLRNVAVTANETTGNPLEVGNKFVDGWLTYEVKSDGTLEVDDCDIAVSVVDVPETITHDGYTYTVTAIGPSSFYNCKSLTNITLPDSVTSIGAYAFESCTSLLEITIPVGVKTIGYKAFYYCNSLIDIDVDDQNEFYSSQDGALLNKNKTTLVKVPPMKMRFDIPDTVKTIGVSAFEYCERIKNITIPEGVTEIEEEAFNQCKALESIVMPDSMQRIGDWAFEYCYGLKNVKISKNVERIGDYAFWSCKSLKSIDVDPNNLGYSTVQGALFTKDQTIIIKVPEMIEDFKMPSGVTTIRQYAFDGCVNLEFIDILTNTTDIGYQAFYNTPKLININVSKNNMKYCSDDGVLMDKAKTTLIKVPEMTQQFTIPGSVTLIDKSAFEGSHIKTVNIPSRVEEISDEVFFNCKYLESITVAATNKLFAAEDGALMLKDKTMLMKVPETKTEYTIPEGIGKIERYAFDNCDQLTSIVIPDSVTGIGQGAFKDCDKLATLTIGNGVTNIGVEAFRECDKLTNVVIPEGVVSIGDWAFELCSGLQSVTIPGTLKNISRAVFKDCTNLTDVTIANGVESIGLETFANCSNLTSINIPSSVKGIGHLAFHGCSKLESINVDENNEYYTTEDGALYNKDKTALILVPESRTEFVIPSNVTSINDYAFDSTALSTVTIPSNITNVGYQAFAHCNNLESINVDENNENYVSENGILYDKNKTTIIKVPAKATEVAMPETLTTIKDHAFEECAALTNVTIPSGVTSIEYEAFRGCTNLTSVTVPSSVVDIRDWAFDGCDQLTLTVDPDSYALQYAKDNGIPYRLSREELVTPAKVTGLKASQNTYSSVKLTWSKVENATGYEISRSTSKEGTYTSVKVVGDVNTATITSLKTGQTYWFKVRAINKGESETVYGEESEDVSATPKMTTAPVLTSVTQKTYGTLQVTWKGVSGAQNYYLERRVAGSKTWKHLKTFASKVRTAESRSLNTGTKYEYRVRCSRNKGDDRAYSPYSNVKGNTPVLKTTTVSVTKKTATSAKVSWKTVSGATAYEVYRATSSTGKYTKIKTTNADTKSMTNSKLVKGKTYYYKVRAYRTIGSKKVYNKYSAVVKYKA